MTMYDYDFLSVANKNSDNDEQLCDTTIWNYYDLDVGFQGHLRSHVMMGIESSYMAS